MEEIIKSLENKRNHVELIIKAEKTTAKNKIDKKLTKLAEKMESLNAELSATFTEIDERYSERLNEIDLALSKLRN